MDEALALAEETAVSVDGVGPERTGAWFWEYGESAMRIRLDYHIEALGRWKEVKDAVNRAIHAAFEDAGFDIAVPTRTVRVVEGERTDGLAAAGTIDPEPECTG